MIVSHRHRFIFLKTRKTAGTSIEIALSKQCGPDDIITPVTPEDEVLREAWGGRGPQNHDEAAQRGKGYNHMGAEEVVDLVGRAVWDSYFKFAVERNPWDAVVSAYFWAHRNKEPVPFSDFIRSDRIERVTKNPHAYRIDGEIAVDKVCLYERLDQDLELVGSLVNLPEPLVLPRAKGQFRRDPRHYREFYSADDADRVRTMFAETVETFGYEF